MTQNISARRGATIAGFAALVLLALLAAFDNQWTGHWRDGRSADGGNVTHSWIAGPVKGLSALAWRATKEAGEPSRLFFGTLAAPVIAVVLTFLLLMLVCRGVGAERGRWSLFLGSWFVTGLAAAAALIVGSSIAGLGAQAKRGDIYYTLTSTGLAFGLFAGWLIGFTAVLVYGSTEPAEEDRTTQEYPTSSLEDYQDYSDYSFSPTSPYSSRSSGSSGSSSSSGEDPARESANAATEITAPPQERDPYGGARPY